MREIDTRVTTYDPEIDYYSMLSTDDPLAIMAAVEDGTGDYVYIEEHDRLVAALQQRILQLENVCYEQMRMLTGD